MNIYDFGVILAQTLYFICFILVSLLNFCQYLCFELALLVAIFFTPWVMIYVFVRSVKINKKYIFLLLSGVNVASHDSIQNKNGHYPINGQPNSKLNLRKGTGSRYSGGVLKLLKKYEGFVNEKREKYQVQLILLKFCECFFHGIPQMCIQLYVYIDHGDHIYDTKLNLGVFYVSMITSGIAIFQLLYECICNTNKTHLIEIFQ